MPEVLLQQRMRIRHGSTAYLPYTYTIAKGYKVVWGSDCRRSLKVQMKKKIYENQDNDSRNLLPELKQFISCNYVLLIMLSVHKNTGRAEGEEKWLD